jgi:hypothetical protein
MYEDGRRPESVYGDADDSRAPRWATSFVGATARYLGLNVP